MKIFFILSFKTCPLAEGAAAKTNEEDDREVVIDFLPCNCVWAIDSRRSVPRHIVDADI